MQGVAGFADRALFSSKQRALLRRNIHRRAVAVLSIDRLLPACRARDMPAGRVMSTCAASSTTLGAEKVEMEEGSILACDDTGSDLADFFRDTDVATQF